MSDLTFVAGDDAPSIFGTLTDAAGAAIDLSPADTSVRFQMRLTSEARFAVDAAAVIVTAVDGKVRYDFVEGDLAYPGDYLARWEIVWGDGQIQHSDPANTITVAAE